MDSALSLADPAQARAVTRLGAYARAALETAARHAHRLHAREVSPEHLLSSLFLDESAAATRLVLFAFADPETLAIELLALSPGILVVGSDRSLPFSVRGVRVLECARGRAIEAGAAAVTPRHLLACALGELDPEALGPVAAVGLPLEALSRTEEPPQPLPQGNPEDPIPPQGPLFARFAQDARRALGLAARAARAWRREAISPAHLTLGALEADGSLAEALGVRPNRVRMALGGRDDDSTPLEPRQLPLDGDLAALLADLEEDASTLAILGRILAGGSEETRLLLRRQRVTWELFERAQDSFQDPPDPAAQDENSASEDLPST